MENILISGGLGFIGSSLASYFLKNSDVRKIFLLDNLIRTGSETRVSSFEKNNRVEIIRVNIDNLNWHSKVNAKIDVFFHCAAQVAVTTSIVDPWLDFHSNASSTLSMLEFARKNKVEFSHEPLFFYSSTNKVYGNLKDLEVQLDKNGYCFKANENGISEQSPAQPITPYGTSKYCGELLVKEYSATFGISAVVFRKSCIFGSQQTGIIDQGWISFMTQSAINDSKLVFFGDGYQTRDVLVVDDLVQCYKKVIDSHVSQQLSKFEIFNIGGGKNNVFSLRKVAELLEKYLSKKIDIEVMDWRQNDQKVYISDISKISSLGWKPLSSVEEEILSAVQKLN